MGAGAQRQVLSTLPVRQVVLASPARQRPVRDLILLVARAGQPLLGPLVLVGLRVGIGRWRAAAFDVARQWRPLLHRQRVEREMLRPQRQRILHALLPALHRLLRQAEDEVQVHVVEPGRPRRAEGLPGVLRGVEPVERAQLVVVEALYAQAEAVEAEIEQPAQVRLVDRAWVRLQRHLRVRCDIEDSAKARHDRAVIVEGREAGRAAAEEERCYWAAGGGAAPELRFVHQRLRVRRYQVLLSRVGVEVAVAALGGAEGDVDVEGERLSHRYSRVA